MLSQGNEKFEGANDEFEEACAEENAFDAARAEESALMAHSQRERKMTGYATGTANREQA